MIKSKVLLRPRRWNRKALLRRDQQREKIRQVERLQMAIREGQGTVVVDPEKMTIVLTDAFGTPKSFFRLSVEERHEYCTCSNILEPNSDCPVCCVPY